MTFVELKGVSNRGKDRVSKHGPWFKITRTYDDAKNIYIESVIDDWYGWVEIDLDVTVESIKIGG